MPRHTLRVLAVAAAALLAGYGCTDVAAPTSSVSPTSLSLVQLPAPQSEPRFNRVGSQSASGVITAEGGVLELESGHRITFPARAVAEPTLITMTAHPTYLGVEMQPHGLAFPEGREPVLSIRYSAGAVSQYRKLSIVYTDDAGNILEVLATTRQFRTHTVSTRLQHFSPYIVGGGN